MQRFIDIHQHIVFGMDDGPSDFCGSVEMLNAAVDDGVEHIIATPHIYAGRQPFDMNIYLDRLEMLNKYCREKGKRLHVHSGAELFFTSETLNWLRSGRIPTLAGSRYVLIEFRKKIPYADMYAAVRSLSHAGYIPVVAHVERYTCLMRDVRRIKELRECLYAKIQVNCDTLLYRRIRFTNLMIDRLLIEHSIDYIATDAHDTMGRKTRMTECCRPLKEHCGSEYAAKLTGGNQSEIIY